jgi:hypothetical protein
MMAVINVTAGSQAILTLGNTAVLAEPDNASGLQIPFMQDLTVNASAGVTRYKVLDSSSEKAFTTPSTNQVTLNALVDDDVFFGNAGVTDNSVATNGLFATSNNKTKIFFSVAFEGSDSTDVYLSGEGFISGLAPTASMDQAVWISPITIEVDGDFTQGTV